MEVFELILILLACVVASSILDQMISRMSLPLLQIGVGLIIAVFFHHVASIHVESELFLMLFIAPLLFREARETSRIMLWNHMGSILSMAIALVLASVLAAGYILHWIIPSIPLAAAFACAAALGPTDAAAVSAMSSVVSLSRRQSILLSGEALINDASGVVSFQFAIAAAVTGAFSAAEAAGTFAVLFFGGIVIGLLLGGLAHTGMILLRRLGYVSTTMHVIYEVLSPFVIFLAAEELHVSGILAVVAAGLIMQDSNTSARSAETARQQMVSNSFWEVIIFLINGILFVMLGMQLPKVMQRDDIGGLSPVIVIAAVLAVTSVIMIMRFMWLSVMELFHRNPETGQRGFREPAASFHQALVTTFSGPKGSVTLSIILTIPLLMKDGSPFPQRDLIIFVTSGVILCTLLLADFFLPRLSPKTVNEDLERQVQEARILIMEGVIREIRAMKERREGMDEYDHACSLAQSRYRTRLIRERFSLEDHGNAVEEAVQEIYDVQQKRADELHSISCDLSSKNPDEYDLILKGIRVSLGYSDGAEKIGSHGSARKSTFFKALRNLKKSDPDLQNTEQIYKDACIFAYELEKAAMDYLKKMETEKDPLRVEIAGMLREEHEAAIESLWNRMMYFQSELPGSYASDSDKEPVRKQEELRIQTVTRFRNVRQYSDEIDANLLSIELDQIRRLRARGAVTEAAARELREQIYLLQTVYLD